MVDIVPDAQEVFAVDPSVNEGPKPQVPIGEVSIVPQAKTIPSEPAARQLTDEERVRNYQLDQAGHARRADGLSQASFQRFAEERGIGQNSAGSGAQEARSIARNFASAPALDRPVEQAPVVNNSGLIDAPVVPPSPGLVQARVDNPTVSVIPRTGVDTRPVFRVRKLLDKLRRRK